jgi:hypothetical protein
MQYIDKTKPREVAILTEANTSIVTPILTILDAELKNYGLEFVITSDILANGSLVEQVEIRKKAIKRTRRSRKSSLLG